MEQTMKTYQIELKRTSYVTLTIEADSAEAAEAQAWREVEYNATDMWDAAWELNEIEEIATC
jgi:hypothetical protein